jgi:hypothetical protein
VTLRGAFRGAAPDPAVVEHIWGGLTRCAEPAEDGRVQLRFTLQNDGQLQALAATLAKLLVAQPAAAAPASPRD